MFSLLSFIGLGAVLSLSASSNAVALHSKQPAKIFGVNLGSWLLIEPWMIPQRWIEMGGEKCDDCSTCIGSEYAFAEAYPDTVDATMAKHWDTWFTKKDVDELVSLGINTVRIPLGYWIVESLVDRRTEFYARGGLKHLRRGLKDLKDAGIAVVLDHHAAPGVATPNQMFAGRCTSEVLFYTPENYHRALVWTAVMTTLSHIDPVFESVFSIQALNEEIMNSAQTPGYGDFIKNFVKVIRAVELTLGMPVPGMSLTSDQTNHANITDGIRRTSETSLFNKEVRAALAGAIIPLARIAFDLGLDFLMHNTRSFTKREHLVTNMMDISWQWGDARSNPADAAIGPQAYDNHLYYSFGGVADANEEAYMIHICNLNRIESDAALGNSPLWFGEWSLATQFSFTDTFMKKWADAQKFSFGKDAGWFFWNFKLEIVEIWHPQWSYFEGVKRGWLTRDPAAFNDPNVCEPYIGKIYVPPSSTSALPSESTSAVPSESTSIPPAESTSAPPSESTLSASESITSAPPAETSATEPARK